MILNLTQHQATPEQVAAGVEEPVDKAAIAALLTFDELPSSAEVASRARDLATRARAQSARAAMIGGAPFLMGPLEEELRRAGVEPLFAFTRREASEETLPDGSVRKTQVFRHAGWVPGLLRAEWATS